MLTLAAAAASLAIQTRTCGYHEGTRVSGEGVAAVRMGATPAQIKTRCAVVSDDLEADDEGNTIGVLRVRVGPAVVAAEVTDGHVSRIRVFDPRLRTSGGFGVGAHLTTLLGLPNLEGGQGEAALYAWSQNLCGVSFGLSYSPTEADQERVGDTWSEGDLRRLPSNTKIMEVLVFGCRPK